MAPLRGALKVGTSPVVQSLEMISSAMICCATWFAGTLKSLASSVTTWLTTVISAPALRSRAQVISSPSVLVVPQASATTRTS